ncbi:MAG: hypothetical protein EOP88_01255 [Verrucomicrobiaceae bacterium]|nr:MAG: hypothetical protein EOP88_01255 [Verrucomicrobiaceae bacterium]
MNATPIQRITKLSEHLDSEFSTQRIIAAFEDALAATTVGHNGCVYADNRTRLAALQLLMSYVEGKAIDRQQVEILTHAADPDVDLAARLRRSPALRRMLRRQLEGADDLS